MPGREGEVEELIYRSLCKGGIFVDVGANIGYYTVLAGKIVGNNGLVIAIEPVPESAKVLKFNVKLNQLRNVKVIQKAVLNQQRIINIYIPRGFFGLASTAIKSSHCNVTRRVQVKATTLDDICKNLKRADLLKIDVEGSEYHVLQGAEDILKRTKCVILETSAKRGEIISFLEKQGFKIRKLKFTTYICALKF
jgi:FkbM family methyltransferase